MENLNEKVAKAEQELQEFLHSECVIQVPLIVRRLISKVFRRFKAGELGVNLLKYENLCNAHEESTVNLSFYDVKLVIDKSNFVDYEDLLDEKEKEDFTVMEYLKRVEEIKQLWLLTTRPYYIEYNKKMQEIEKLSNSKDGKIITLN